MATVTTLKEDAMLNYICGAIYGSATTLTFVAMVYVIDNGIPGWTQYMDMRLPF